MNSRAIHDDEYSRRAQRKYSADFLLTKGTLDEILGQQTDESVAFLQSRQDLAMPIRARRHVIVREKRPVVVGLQLSVEFLGSDLVFMADLY